MSKQTTNGWGSFTDANGRTWGPMEGFNGPMMDEDGTVTYWDIKEGKLYDPIRDAHTFGPKYSARISPSAGDWYSDQDETYADYLFRVSNLE